MARCRVCHRPLHDPAHVAAGVGPVCAQRAAAFGVGTGAAPEQAAYPPERLARIKHHVARCWQAVERMERNLTRAREIGSADDVAFGEWLVWFTWRWYERWSAIERRVKQSRRIASVAA